MGVHHRTRFVWYLYVHALVNRPPPRFQEEEESEAVLGHQSTDATWLPCSSEKIFSCLFKWRQYKLVTQTLKKANQTLPEC